MMELENSPLLAAVTRGDRALVERELREGADVNERNRVLEFGRIPSERLTQLSMESPR